MRPHKLRKSQPYSQRRVALFFRHARDGKLRHNTALSCRMQHTARHIVDVFLVTPAKALSLVPQTHALVALSFRLTPV